MRLKVEYDTSNTFKRNLDAIAIRAKDLTPAQEFVYPKMWQGPGSVADQFARESQATVSGFAAWPKTKPFGNRAAPAKTLQRSGALMRAWTGVGPGAVPDAFPAPGGGTTFSVGVDTGLFPYAAVHQAFTPTVIKAKTPAKTRKGSAMHYFLGMQFGVWISEAKLRAGLTIPPRRIGVGPEMRSRVAEFLARWISQGDAPLRSEAGIGKAA